MVWCDGCGCLAGMMYMYPSHITDIPNGTRLNGGECQNPSYESRWNADKWQELKIQMGKKRVLTMMMWLLLLVSPSVIVGFSFFGSVFSLLPARECVRVCVCVRIFVIINKLAYTTIDQFVATTANHFTHFQLCV